MPTSRQGENRQTIQEFCFAEFFSFCTRLLVKQEFPAAKALVGMTRFGTQKALTYQLNSDTDCRFQRRFGTQKALTYQKPQAKAGHSPPASKDEKTLQEGNRQTIAKSAAFCSFCTRQWVKQKLPDAKASLSLDFARFFKSEVSFAFPKPKQDSSTRLTAQSE